MPTSLYVGNLPYTESEDQLRQLFAEAGTVVGVRLPMDRDTGRPRGFGFVEMSNEDEAKNAAKMFNGYSLDGRDLRVNMAEERPEGAGRQGGGGGGGRGRY